MRTKPPSRLALPQTPRPCALVRDSSEEQVDQFSLPMQTLKVQEHCRDQLDVALPESAIYREEGVSGRPGTLKKRPGLNAALEACLAGTYTHLVVHKLDRLGRNVGLVSSVLEQLDEAGVIFVSVQDRVDASTAAGRLYIAIFIAIAQWYSDNLSEETKKGKEGRKRAGLYNGTLPFGVMRGEGVHAVPLPDLRPISLTGNDGVVRPTTNHAGLIQAFEWCSHGSSAREIAVKLNAQGYRTTGTWGSNPFSKDTIQRLLSNRFYLGQLPDGQDGWIEGQHTPLISEELWDQAQRARIRHRKNPQTIPGHARIHVLGGGLLRCGICALQGRSSALHVSKSRKDVDEAYYACYGRFQGQPCTQSAVADHVLETQLTGFFDAFDLPDDFQTRILDLYQREHQTANAGENNPAARRAQLEARLERQRHLYELGDWTRERYLAARNETLSELAELDMSHPVPPTEDPEAITRLGAYVRELRTAWRDADKAQRRLLVRTLFEQIWVVGDRLFAAKPVPQFAPFFRLVRNLHGEDVEQRVYLAPTFSLHNGDPDEGGPDEVEEMGEVGKKMAQNLDGIEDTGRLSRQLREVQTGGPDGTHTLYKRAG